MQNKHLLLKFEKVNNIELLKIADNLEKEIDPLLQKMDFHIVGKSKKQFEPFGATLIYLLAESHFSIHTFWEEKEVYMDLFCCSDFDEILVTKLLKNIFNAKLIFSKVILRNDLNIYE
jgi:S-adenosylmethionine decarboxylase